MKPMSKNELLFADIIGAFGLPTPSREHEFDPDRKWRFDFAWIDQKIAVEIHGGRYHRGNMDKDYEKQNAAVRQGWRVFVFSSSMLASEIKRYQVGEFMESVIIKNTKEIR